jgi:hypothetical protein
VNGYLVSWHFDVEDAPNPDQAARQAYDAFMRPDSIAHVFDVAETVDATPEDAGGLKTVTVTTLTVVDLDWESGDDGEPLAYPASDYERRVR